MIETTSFYLADSYISLDLSTCNHFCKYNVSKYYIGPVIITLTIFNTQTRDYILLIRIK